MNKQLITFFHMLVPATFLMLIPATAQASEVQLTAAQLKNISLTIASVAIRKNTATIQINGVLVADARRTHRVASIVAGIVTDLQVVANEKVRRGQVLARLLSHDLGQAQGNYLEALALFELAKSNQSRIEGLWKEGVVAESRWREAESEYQIARASFESRRRMLSLAGLTSQQILALNKQPGKFAEFSLTSPIDGIVTGMDIEQGQLLGVGEAAFHIDDLSLLWAMVKIPVASLPQVKIGADAIIRVQASPEQSYQGKLESLGGEVDIQSQTLSGRIILNNPNGVLRPGMYAEVSLNAVAHQGLMIPASAVFRIGDQAYVFRVLGQGRFEPVAIAIGAEANGWIPVHSGIEAGSQVASSGVAELKSHWQYQGGE